MACTFYFIFNLKCYFVFILTWITEWLKNWVMTWIIISSYKYSFFILTWCEPSKNILVKMAIHSFIYFIINIISNVHYLNICMFKWTLELFMEYLLLFLFWHDEQLKCIFKLTLNYYYYFIYLLIYFNFRSNFVLSSSQWQQRQQGGAVVLLWGSGAGGHDPRTRFTTWRDSLKCGESYKILSVFHNINASSPRIYQFYEWMSNSTEDGKETWWFASPPVCFWFAPVVVLFIVCFGKGCDFELLIHWVCFIPTWFWTVIFIYVYVYNFFFFGLVFLLQYS